MKKKLQEFQIGDLVKIADELPDDMSHFTKGCYAIVVGTYAQLCDSTDIDDYCSYQLLLKGEGTSAWYPEDVLELIESNPVHFSDFWVK